MCNCDMSWVLCDVAKWLFHSIPEFIEITSYNSVEVKVFKKRFQFEFEFALFCFFTSTSILTCPSVRKYVLTWLGLWLSIPIDSTYFEWEIRRIEKSIPVHLGGCVRIFFLPLRFGPVSPPSLWLQSSVFAFCSISFF